LPRQPVDELDRAAHFRTPLRFARFDSLCGVDFDWMASVAKTSETTLLQGIVPFPPMEAELVREPPDDDGWQYEPKS